MKNKKLKLKFKDNFLNRLILITLFIFVISVIFLLPIKNVQADANSFVSTWDTTKTSSGSSNSNQVRLPLSSKGTYSFIVDWGDGNSNSITAYNQPEITHTYATEGVYEITIDGTINGFIFNNYGDKLKITEISQWGNLRLVNNPSEMYSYGGGYFYGTFNLSITAIDILDLTGIANMAYAFANSGISTVPNMDNWDVSNVTNMSTMFYNTRNFNQNIDNWDVSNVTQMDRMFMSANSFNESIGDWDISNVTSMTYMFNSAGSFNQPIGDWDISSVDSVLGMFCGARAFNQPLGDWNVSGLTNLDEMFCYTDSFNQDLSSWDVSNITSMYGIFGHSSSFNQDLSSWDVSNVTNMRYMFDYATSFNQDLSSWNVSGVTNMENMFSGATSFNQDLSSWDVSNVTNMSGMFEGVTLSTTNYNNLLTGWDSLLSLKSNVNFYGGNSKYAPGDPANARQSLIDNYNWTITDGGEAEAIFNLSFYEYLKNTNPGNVEVLFVNSAIIPVNGKIKLTIPDEFYANNIFDLSSHIITFTANGSDVSINSAELSGRMITITIGEEIDAYSDIIITFDDEVIDKNPLAEGIYVFNLKTYDESNSQLEEMSDEIRIFEKFLYYLDSWSNLLYKIIPGTLTTISTSELTASNDMEIYGSTGAVVDPITNEVYAVLSLDSYSTRYLAKLNMETNEAEVIANLNYKFAGIAFDETGQLYGLTGDGDPTYPSSLFSINKINIDKTLLASYDIDNKGEAIAYNTDDNKIYRATGDAMYKIDPLDPTHPEVVYEENLDLSGDYCTGIMHKSGNEFYFIEWSEISNLNTTTGDIVYLRDLDGAAKAIFEWAPITTYTLAYTAGTNGSISGTSPQTINEGEDGTQVEAVPDTGYHFVNWSDSSTDNPRTDTNVTTDITVEANFAEDAETYTLTYIAGENGTISGTSPQTINSGEDGEEVQAIPNPGYHFTNWSDDSTDNPRTDTNVLSDITVTANFAIDGEEENNNEDDQEDEEKKQEDKIKIKSIKSSCDKLEITVDVENNKKEKLDFIVEFKNQKTNNKDNLKFENIKTNNQGQATLTLSPLKHNSTYQVKAKFKNGGDDYSEWSNKEEGTTNGCIVTIPTKEETKQEEIKKSEETEKSQETNPDQSVDKSNQILEDDSGNQQLQDANSKTKSLVANNQNEQPLGALDSLVRGLSNIKEVIAKNKVKSFSLIFLLLIIIGSLMVWRRMQKQR